MVISMIDLKNYKVVDLSKAIRPGILKINGEYIHGDQVRRLELREFVYQYDKCIMHWIDTETHIGTHVEGPSHYPSGNKLVSELPLDTFMGEGQ